MRNEIIFLLVFLGVSGIMTILVIIGTFTKNDWGINIDPIVCPNCGGALSSAKKPKTMRQFLWGGGTCGVCGTVMDKWGRRVGLFR